MASSSRVITTTSLLLSLILIFFTLVSSTNAPCPSPSNPPLQPTCPRDTLKLGVCMDLLKSLLGLVVGTPPPKAPCCSLIENLADIEAAVCLCNAIKSDLLGKSVDIPLCLTLLLNYCGKSVPSDFQCA